MARILVVENDPHVSSVIAHGLGETVQVEVDCVASVDKARQMIANRKFDFALIAVMRDYSGLALAEHAANENIPVLLTSGNPLARIKLQQFGYPYLFKPYEISSLIQQAALIMEDAAANIQRVKASATRMTTTLEALTAAMVQSRRIIAESRQIMSRIKDSQAPEQA